MKKQRHNRKRVKQKKIGTVWTTIAFWSLIVFVVSASLMFLVDVNKFTFWTTVVSGIILVVACENDYKFDIGEGSSPWYYGAL